MTGFRFTAKGKRGAKMSDPCLGNIAPRPGRGFPHLGSKGHEMARQAKAGRPDLLGRFAKHLNRRRTEKKWSLRKLAARAGCAHTNIFQFENLRKNPTLTELAALGKAFDQSLTEFLSGINA
jgi:ribosome-binding protein aMBF1 (putative translation factor)